MRAGQARDFHREDVMARGDATSALVDHPVERDGPEQLRELGAEYRRGLERPVGIDVAGVRSVARTRDVAGDRIERLRVATKALACPRVDDRERAFAEAVEDAPRVD